MIRSIRLAALILVLPLAAQAQTAPSAAPPAQQDIAPALRGTYAAPDCTAPTNVLHVTAHSILRLARDGDTRLYRGQSIAARNDWTILTSTSAGMPRVILRAAEQGVDEALPDDKLRDDQLPGTATVQRYARCTSAPALLAPHAEGIAVLQALETVEPSCQTGPTPACMQAVFTAADITKDGQLSPAEIARVVRGVTWILQAVAGTKEAELAAGYLASVTLGTAMAQTIVQAYDYDHSGTLSLAEINQDRQPFPLLAPTRPTAVAPLPLDPLATRLQSGLSDMARSFFGLGRH